MARRFVSFGLRRPVRDRGASGGAGGGVSQRPPLDPLMIDYWHSELGVSLAGGVSSWTGQILGMVVPFSGARPAYAADGASFNGRNVVQCSVSASLYATGLAPFVALGTYPYVVSVFRFRAAPASGFQSVLAFGVTSVIDLVMLRAMGSGTPILQLNTPAVTLTAQSPMDVVPHRWEAWIDGVNLNSRLDGALVSAPSTQSTTNTATAIGIGNAAGGAGVFRSDTSHAFHALFSAKPSDAYLTQLRAWALGYWGV